MKGLEFLRPALADYELIDSGDGLKLERFGEHIVWRPEPQALWRRSLSEEDWARLATAIFRREGRSEERGQWQLGSGMPERWTMRYDRGEMHLRMRLALTGFKHVGVFPEQADNWNFIYDTLKAMPGGGAGARVLNLFAYTGGASLAAWSAGAEVTHVDSVRQTVSWARDNLSLCEADAGPSTGSVRWIVDDALKFVRREVRRGNTYDGIVLDPPAYGRGPDGEKWVLEENLEELLSLCAQLLKPAGFFVLNLYSMGLSAIVARTAAHACFGPRTCEQFGELYFTDRAGKDLPLGVYYRFKK